MVPLVLQVLLVFFSLIIIISLVTPISVVQSYDSYYSCSVLLVLLAFNVLSAPIFLECRSAPAPCQNKEWHSHIAPFEKREWHSFIALS